MMNYVHERRSVHTPNPTTGAYVRRITEDAKRWSAFATTHAQEYSGLSPEKIHRKALDAVAFTLACRAHALAVPSKLAHTSRHQETLQVLAEIDLLPGTQLCTEMSARTDSEEVADPEVAGPEIAIYFGRQRLGVVQRKHAWLRPLLPFGATVHLLAVTGGDAPRKFYGCNVCFAHVGAAIARLEAGGDGLGGTPCVDLAKRESAPQGRAQGQPQRVTSNSVSVAPGGEDIVLWRDTDGAARASVEHIVRHSPTGIEWASAGSGAADLAYSILCHVAGEDAARRHAYFFKHEVVARVPFAGGVIAASTVRQWLREKELLGLPALAAAADPRSS